MNKARVVCRKEFERIMFEDPYKNIQSCKIGSDKENIDNLISILKANQRTDFTSTGSGFIYADKKLHRIFTLYPFLRKYINNTECRDECIDFLRGKRSDLYELHCQLFLYS